MSKPHLFLLESDPAVCRTLEMSLRDAQYTVTATTELDVARTLLEEIQPAFVLIDLDHSGAGALEFCEGLRANRIHRDTIILAMSQRHDLTLRVRALDLQIFDFFKKPVLVGEVLTRLRTLSNRAQYSTILRASSRSKLMGALDETTPYDLLSAVSRGGRSAVLSCKTALGPFHCWFTEGELTDAQLGQLHGEDSIYAFLGERRGNYEIEFREVHRNRSVRDSLPEILAHALERIDSWNELLETLPPLSTVVRAASDLSGAPALAEQPQVRTLLRRASHGIRLGDLMRAEQPRDVALAAMVSKMYFYGLVEAVDEATDEDGEEDSLTSLERWEEPPLGEGAGLDDADAPVRVPARAAAISTKSDLPPAPNYVTEGAGEQEVDAVNEPMDEAAAEDAGPITTTSLDVDSSEADSGAVEFRNSYVDVDAVIPTTTSPVQTNQFAGEDYVDVDQIATAPARAEASHGSRRIDEVREEIRRSQLDVGATGSGGSIGGEMDGGVAQLAGRADAILEEADDTHLMETHTDPYPPPDESADFSDLNEDLSTEGLEAFIEQSSGFAKSAPVLTGPLAEESLAGYAVVDVEAQLESRHESRSRSESGVIRGDLGSSGRDVEAVDRASQPVKINREMTLTREPPLAVDVTHASPSGLRGRTLSESGADFDRLRTLAGIETDTVPIRSGHRPAYESTRASIPAQNEAAPSPNEEAELPPRPLPPRERTQTRVGLPPPGAVNVGNKSADPVAEDPAPAPTASTSRGGIPRELPTGDLAPSESMVATLSSGPSWWRRNWIYVIFGAALALVGFLFSGSDRALVNRGVVTDGTTGGSGNAASPDPSADASVNPSADASADASEGAPEEASNVAAEMESSSSSTTGTGAGSDATEATDTDATDESRASVETGGDGEPGTDSSAAEPSEGEAAVAVNDSVDAATPSMVEVGEGSEAGGSVEASSAPVADDSTTGAPETTPTAEEAFESAKELFDRGKYGDASEEIDRALALDSGWPEALLLRGKIHLERGEFEEAMGQARKVTLVAPGLVEAHIVIGVAEEALGSKEGAIAAYQRFLLVAPDHVYATSIRKELKRLGAEPPP